MSGRRRPHQRLAHAGRRPLADNIGAAVADNLTAVLGSSRVTLAAAAPGADADFPVAIEMQRFESPPGSHALLDAAYSARRVLDGAAAHGRTPSRENVRERNHETLAAAHSKSLARLARDIADTLGQLAAAPPAAAQVRAGTSPAR